MPLSINMSSTENEKRSMKEHIDKYLAMSSKVVVQNKKMPEKNIVTYTRNFHGLNLHKKKYPEKAHFVNENLRNS